jgi:alpha-D-ribose 1-methylphosphonate 5-triphosphate synthase subunit PhnH
MQSSVHATARAYRKLLLASNYPGRRYDLAVDALEYAFDLPFCKGMMLLVQTLIDGEVGFKVVGRGAQEAARLISRLTYGRPADLETADFIIILEEATAEEKEEALKKSKVGTLVDPHDSATFLIAVKHFGHGNDLVLRGPGIKDNALVSLEGQEDLMGLREGINREYPLGIDMVFVDAAGEILALPRTTQIKRRSSSWPM